MPEELPEMLRLLAYQTELCPDTQREHIQFYLACKKPSKPATVMAALQLTNRNQARLYALLRLSPYLTCACERYSGTSRRARARSRTIWTTSARTSRASLAPTTYVWVRASSLASATT